MRFLERTLARAAVVLLVLLAGPITASGQTDPACSAAITNANCTITINRDAPSSPLTMKMKKGATATLVVSKRPLDTIQLEVTTTDIEQPDPVSAILTAFLPALAKLTFATKLVSPKETGTQPFKASALTTLPPGPYNNLTKRLGAISDRQTDAESQLKLVKAAVDGAAGRLREFQDRSIEAWQTRNFAAEQTTLVATMTDASSMLQPGGLVAVLRVALDDVTKAFAALPPPPDGGSQAELDALIEKINEVGFNQARLEAGVKAIDAAQATLDQAAGIVKRIDGAHAFSFSRAFTQDVNDVGRSVTVKITSQDAVSKTATALATIAMIWNETRWEVSAGAVFSWLENRSFQNAPIVVNGVPKLNVAGQVLTVVTETVTRPSVVPFALMHYRLGEASVGGRRLAALATGGIGINVSSGTADFGVGGSVAYRLLVVSGLFHFGRDQRLMNGVKPGDELGSSPPTLATERFWRATPGIALSLRVPF